MTFRRFLICSLFCGIIPSIGKVAANNSNSIYVFQGKYGINFYHMEYILTPENTSKPFGKGKFGPRAFQISDGQFEIFIKKELFPIPSPAKDYLILRMPSGDHPSKVELFESIKKMLESKKGSLKVIL